MNEALIDNSKKQTNASWDKYCIISFNNPKNIGTDKCWNVEMLEYWNVRMTE